MIREHILPNSSIAIMSKSSCFGLIDLQLISQVPTDLLMPVVRLGSVQWCVMYLIRGTALADWVVCMCVCGSIGWL